MRTYGIRPAYDVYKGIHLQTFRSLMLPPREPLTILTIQAESSSEILTHTNLNDPIYMKLQSLSAPTRPRKISNTAFTSIVYTLPRWSRRGKICWLSNTYDKGISKCTRFSEEISKPKFLTEPSMKYKQKSTYRNKKKFHLTLKIAYAQIKRVFF